MSDNIPVEIQMEIIQRIPDIKSVMQYRSVSKAWKSIIDSTEFVTGHTRRHIQQQPRRLLIRGQDFDNPPKEVRYVSIVDDDTFPHQKFNFSIPDFCKDARARLMGSSHGLFCLYHYNRNMAIIWNPSIRKTVLTTVVPYESCTTYALFGVCHNTLDPKIVKIPYPVSNAQAGAQVEVFTLSSGAWRSPLTNTCLCESIGLGHSRAVVDGFLYCNAYDHSIIEGGIFPSLIMSFDLTSEEFTELYLPSDGGLYVSNLMESLGVFQYNCDTHNKNFNIWIMKGSGCTRSFEKLYHISPSDASISMTRAFRKNGAPIVEVETFAKDLHFALAAYEPESKDITKIWSVGIANTFRVHSYMETLLLLGQLDYSICFAIN